VEFAVGAVQLESVPAGAAVYAATDGSSVGVTPIMITNLLPSIVAYKLQAAGYEDAMVSATVIENQTTAVSTNLVKLEYRSNLNLAKSLLQSGNYDQALAAVDLAIAAKPGDAEATSLRQEISVRQLMQQAHDLAGQSDYAGAAAKLAAALQIQPDNRDVQSLMTQLQTERQNRPGQIFAAVLKKVPNSSLFEQHLMTTSKPAKDVQAAVVAVLKSSNPPFQVLPVETPEPDIYKIYLTQTLARGVLDTPYRECAIVVGQSKPDETQIWFKVMEFQIHHDAVLNSLIHVQDKKEYIPVHPSRIQMTDELQAQVRDGTKVMADKIIQAIEQP
jgi:tetratricopeptide (TPR) repeat protein